MNPEGMMIEIITDRLGRSAVCSSQNYRDVPGDLRGVLNGCEVSTWRTLAGLTQSMCLLVNTDVIFHNRLWSCQLSQSIVITKRDRTVQ